MDFDLTKENWSCLLVSSVRQCWNLLTLAPSKPSIPSSSHKVFSSQGTFLIHEVIHSSKDPTIHFSPSWVDDFDVESELSLSSVGSLV